MLHWLFGAQLFALVGLFADPIHQMSQIDAKHLSGSVWCFVFDLSTVAVVPCATTIFCNNCVCSATWSVLVAFMCAFLQFSLTLRSESRFTYHPLFKQTAKSELRCPMLGIAFIPSHNIECTQRAQQHFQLYRRNTRSVVNTTHSQSAIRTSRRTETHEQHQPIH